MRRLTRSRHRFRRASDGKWLAGGPPPPTPPPPQTLSELWFGHDTNHDEQQEAKDFKGW